MRESVRSIRTYFFIVGIVGGGAAVLNLLQLRLGFQTLMSLLALGLAAAFLYVAIRFNDLLVSSPDRIQQLVLANASIGTVNILVTTLITLNRSAVFWVALAYVAAVLAMLWGIAYYLITNVRRLSAVAQTPAVSEQPDPASVVPAGWHPDPAGRYPFRYWDGASWTQHVSVDGRVENDEAGLAMPQQDTSQTAQSAPNTGGWRGSLGRILAGVGIVGAGFSLLTFGIPAITMWPGPEDHVSPISVIAVVVTPVLIFSLLAAFGFWLARRGRVRTAE